MEANCVVDYFTNLGFLSNAKQLWTKEDILLSNVMDLIVYERLHAHVGSID